MSLRRIGKDSVIYALGNAGMRLAAFLLIPVYTHSLSISAYGLWTMIQLTMQVMFVFMVSGMSISLVRFTKECKEKNQYGELLGTSSLIIFVMGLIVTVISLTFLINFFRKIFHLDTVYFYITMTCLAILLQSLVIHLMTYYRVEKKVFKFMVIGLASSANLILVSGVFIWWLKFGVMGALWAFVITYFIFLIYLCWDIFSGVKIGVSWPLIPKLLQFGSPLIFSGFALFVFDNACLYILSYFVGLDVVAVYSLGFKLASVLSILIILPFQLSFEPFVFLNLDKPATKETVSKLLTLLILVLIFSFFCILFGSRLLLPIIAPPEYSWAILVTLFLLPARAFVGIYHFGSILLGAAKKTHITGFVMTIFALASIVINYLLIQMMGWYGGIIASNFCSVLSGLIFLALGKKYFPFSIEWKRISVCVIIAILFFLVFLALGKVQLETFILLSLLTGLGSLVILWKFKFFSPGEIALFKEMLQRRIPYEI